MKNRIALIAACLVLTACGGGGGGGNNRNNPDPNNLVPTVDAGPNRSINSGQQVTLTGAAFDSDGSIAAVQWQQTAGSPVVQIEQADTNNASFFAPVVSQPSVLSFSFTATDNSNAIATDTVTITLLAPQSNLPPIIDQPLQSQRGNTGETFTLTATASDPDGQVVQYSWQLISANPTLPVADEPTLLNNDDADAPASFVAPSVEAPTTLTFRLTVSDNASSPNTASAETSVLIYPVPQPAKAAQLYVANTTGRVRRYNSTASSPREFSTDIAYGQFDTGAGTLTINRAIALSTDGRMVHADDEDANGISEVCAIARRAGNDQFDDNRDRRITHDFDDLNRQENYSGVALIHSKGYLVAIDTFNGAGSQDSRAIHVYGSAISGTTQLIADIPLGGNAHDLVYDEAGDRLFVTQTNGRIAVFDNFISDVEISRSIVESNQETAGGPAGGNIEIDALISIGAPGDASTILGRNLRGIEYHAASDRLIVSDVGIFSDVNASDPTAARSDGAIYILSDASSASASGFSRAIEADAVIRGAAGATPLGDPNDIALNGRDLIVADSANDVVYVYRDIFNGVGDRADAPVESLNVAGASFVASQALDTIERPHVNDLSPALAADPAMRLLALRQFDDGGSQTAQITRLSADLSDSGQVPTLQFAVPADHDLRGLSVANNGDVYISRFAAGDAIILIPLGSPDSTTVTVVNSAAKNRLDLSGAASTSGLRDRSYSLAGGEDLEQAQKTLIIDEYGVMLVADGGGGNAAGIAITTVCGEGALLGAKLPTQGKVPTDMDFDGGNGDLYISFADGDFGIFRAFDRYLESLVANPATPVTPNPLLVVTPTKINPDGTRTAAVTDLSAIEYLPVLDQLVLASSGDAANNSDGQLLIIGRVNGFAASQLFGGTVDENVTISGPQSMLGRPVDLAFNGTDLYVAERGNGMILKFDNIETIASDGDRSPSAVFPQTGIRAIVPLPSYIGSDPNTRQ